jgi:predicted metalloprotease with PDZ domain
MKQKFRHLILLLLLCGTVAANAQNKYRYTLNLNNVKDDKIEVELVPPVLKGKEVIYNFPKIVPGTYSEDDFGRYIESFVALDKAGKELPVEKININSWKISNAPKLAKIKYKVNDSFDDKAGGKAIFEPCGSNIQQDTNYLINNHCFFGYFSDLKNVPFEVTVLHPSTMYGGTPLTDLDKRNTVDRFTANNYNFLVDNPIMYAAPDTATITVGKSQVLLAVYSPQKKMTASFLSEKLKNLLQAQVSYLGGTMPVKKYAFLVYLNNGGGLSGSQGALEHSYSSVYYMPEGTDDNIVQFFLDVASHEFFHIVTPLNLHAEQIHYFDFNEPKMSEHLWLYEGTTEYHAHLAQERYGLITKDDFIKTIGQKINLAKNIYNDSLPFTVMSANVLHQYSKQFGNVYQKGALIAMCIDLKLRKLSNGKKGIIDMILDLSKTYGKDKPFKDEELFAAIEKTTYPEIKQFLETYVAGSTKLPLKEVLLEAGVELIPLFETKDSTFSLGGLVYYPPGEDKKMRISDVSNMNAFGKAMGYKKDDELVSINGQPADAATMNKIIPPLYKTAKPGDILTIVVKRKNENGEVADVTLSAPMTKIPVFKANVLRFVESPTQEQKALQDSWLNAKQ